MQNLAKNNSTFLQDIPFISICFTINTSKCKILQKGKRLFCKIFHLLVYDLLLILANGTILQKGKRLFCKIFHYLLVYDLLLILVNAQSCKKVKSIFLQDIPFIIVCDLLLILTSKCTILQKGKRLFSRYSIY